MVAILKYRRHCAELEIYSIKLLTKIQTGRNLSWASKYTALLWCCSHIYLSSKAHPETWPCFYWWIFYSSLMNYSRICIRLSYSQTGSGEGRRFTNFKIPLFQNNTNYHFFLVVVIFHNYGFYNYIFLKNYLFGINARIEEALS